MFLTNVFLSPVVKRFLNSCKFRRACKYLVIFQEYPRRSLNYRKRHKRITRKKRRREEILLREFGKKKKKIINKGCWLRQQCQELTALPEEKKQMFSGNI